MKPSKNKTRKINLIEKELWQLCRQIVKRVYGNTCYTCGKKNLIGADYQIGHMIPRSVGGAYLKYDLRNLRVQCSYCNKWQGGNGAVYQQKMTEEMGKPHVDQIHKDRTKQVDSRTHWTELISKYKHMLTIKTTT